VQLGENLKVRLLERIFAEHQREYRLEEYELRQIIKGPKGFQRVDAAELEAILSRKGVLGSFYKSLTGKKMERKVEVDELERSLNQKAAEVVQARLSGGDLAAVVNYFESQGVAKEKLKAWAIINGREEVNMERLLRHRRETAEIVTIDAQKIKYRERKEAGARGVEFSDRSIVYFQYQSGDPAVKITIKMRGKTWQYEVQVGKRFSIYDTKEGTGAHIMATDTKVKVELENGYSVEMDYTQTEVSAAVTTPLGEHILIYETTDDDRIIWAQETLTAEDVGAVVDNYLTNRDSRDYYTPALELLSMYKKGQPGHYPSTANLRDEDTIRRLLSDLRAAYGQHVADETRKAGNPKLPRVPGHYDYINGRILGAALDREQEGIFKTQDPAEKVDIFALTELIDEESLRLVEKRPDMLDFRLLTYFKKMGVIPQEADTDDRSYRVKREDLLARVEAKLSGGEIDRLIEWYRIHRHEGKNREQILKEYMENELSLLVYPLMAMQQLGILDSEVVLYDAEDKYMPEYLKVLESAVPKSEISYHVVDFEGRQRLVLNGLAGISLRWQVEVSALALSNYFRARLYREKDVKLNEGQVYVDGEIVFPTSAPGYHPIDNPRELYAYALRGSTLVLCDDEDNLSAAWSGLKHRRTIERPRGKRVVMQYIKRSGETSGFHALALEYEAIRAQIRTIEEDYQSDKIKISQLEATRMLVYSIYRIYRAARLGMINSTERTDLMIEASRILGYVGM
jgi:hypothetical protein